VTVTSLRTECYVRTEFKLLQFRWARRSGTETDTDDDSPANRVPVTSAAAVAAASVGGHGGHAGVGPGAPNTAVHARHLPPAGFQGSPQLSLAEFLQDV